MAVIEAQKGIEADLAMRLAKARAKLKEVGAAPKPKGRPPRELVPQTASRSYVDMERMEMAMAELNQARFSYPLLTIANAYGLLTGELVRCAICHQVLDRKVRGIHKVNHAADPPKREPAVIS